ncbi:MAG: hypothetical protein NVS2B8_03580 [Vulcanimicrobiaceae bacterium]
MIDRPTDAVEPLDLAALREVFDDEAALLGFATDALHHFDVAFRDLIASVASQDAAHGRALAHRLAGTAGTVGADRLIRSLVALENALAAGDWYASSPYMQEAIDARSAIDGWLARRARNA